MVTISLSLSRVSTALNKVNADLDQPKGALKNPHAREELVQTFKDLQFQIKELESTLEKYQQEATNEEKP